MKPLIPLSEPLFGKEERSNVEFCLSEGWISSAGPQIGQFEKNVSEYLGVKGAVACSSGTAALHLSLLATNIPSGEEVIVPTLTFIAPINAVHYVGATPVFMDCDDALNMDINKVIEFLLTECRKEGPSFYNRRSNRRIAAILPVHLFGMPLDLEPLLEVLKDSDVVLIEDACHAIGSCYLQGNLKNRYAGTIGRVGCFSFNGNKLLSAGGGGALVSNDETLLQRARYLSNQAKDDALFFVHNEVGYNYRMNNLQAGIGLAQLSKLDSFVEIKRKRFQQTQEAFRRFPELAFIPEPSWAFSNRWYFTAILQMNDDLPSVIKKMEAKNIHVRPLWHLNHQQKPYKDCQAYRIKKAPLFARRVLNLPCSLSLTPSEIEIVSNTLIKILHEDKCA